eukprot:2308774-Rhodomonas_salina.4
MLRPVALIKRDIIDKVPAALGIDLAKSTYHEVLEMCPLFDGIAPTTRNSLYRCLRPTHVAPGECIARRGELSSSIIFILTGGLHVVSDDDEPKKEAPQIFADARALHNEPEAQVVDAVESEQQPEPCGAFQGGRGEGREQQQGHPRHALRRQLCRRAVLASWPGQVPVFSQVLSRPQFDLPLASSSCGHDPHRSVSRLELMAIASAGRWSGRTCCCWTCETW